MPRASKKPAALRDSWRLPEDQRGQSWWQIRVYRALLTALAIGLSLAFFYLLFRPFWHPTTRLIAGSSSPYDAARIRPIEFAREDLAAVEGLLSEATLPMGRRPLVQLHVLGTPEDFALLSRSLQEQPASRSDVFIIYLAAHGVTIDGEPYLLCQNFDPSAPESGRFPLESLLNQLRDVTAGVKLLVLDAGRIAYEPRLGVIVNEFPRQIESRVSPAADSQTGGTQTSGTPAGVPQVGGPRMDAGLWVLSSHGPLERAHVDPSHRRSLFGAAVTRAFGGAADLNGDREITIAEFACFVRGDVQAHAARLTNNQETQTPQLTWGGGSLPDESATPTILSAPRRTTELEKFAADAAQDSLRKRTAGKLSGGRAAKSADASMTGSTQESSSTPGGVADDATSAGSAAGESSGAADSGSTAAGGASTASTSGSTGPAGSDGPASAASRTTSGGSKGGNTNGAMANGGGGSRNGSSSAGRSSADGPATLPPLGAPLAPLLAYGWHESERVEQTGDERESVAERAPHWWRAWQERLLAHERMADSSASTDDVAISAALRRDLAALFAPGQAVEVPRPHASVRGLLDAVLIPPEGAGSLPSLGLTERLAATSSVPGIPADFQRWLADFERLLGGEQRTDFQAFVDKPWPTGYDRFIELRFARQLVDTPNVPWRLIGAAWRALRLGERIAAHPDAYHPWSLRRLDRADRWQWASRREWTNQVGRGWDERAEEYAALATREYRLLERDLVSIRQARQHAVTWRLRAPQYVALAARFNAASDDGIATVDLLAFLNRLSEFQQMIAAPAELDTVELADAQERLAVLQTRIESAWRGATLDGLLSAAPSDFAARQRMSILLESPLLSAAAREQLLFAAATWDEAAAEAASIATTPARWTDFASRPVPVEQWRVPLKQLEVEIQLAQLARLDADAASESSDAESTDEALALEHLWRTTVARERLDDSQSDAVADEFAYWRAFRTMGGALRRFYDGLPTRITKSLADNADLTQATTRAERIRALRVATDALGLVDPRDAARITIATPTQTLAQAMWYDALIGSSQRAIAAMEDTDTGERAPWTMLLAECRRLAERVASQPALPALPVADLIWDGPTEISLTSAREQSVELTLELRGPSDAPAWVVVDFDPDLIAVSSRQTVYTESNLREQAAAVPIANATAGLADARAADPRAAESRAAVFSSRDPDRRAVDSPFRPDWANIVGPSFVLSPGEPVTISLNLRRLGRASPRSRVVVKAITADGYVRRPIDVKLPVLQTLAIVPTGPAGTWTSTADGVILHPIPGHSTDFQLNLANGGDTAKTLDIEWYAPLTPLGGDSADEFVTLESRRLVEQLSSARLLAKRDKVVVPATGDLIPVGPPLLVGQPVGESPTGPDGGAGAAAPSGTSGDGAEAIAPTSKPPGPPAPSIGNGLVLVARDVDTGQTLVRRVRFQPLRPRRYLDVTATYDPAAQRLDITATALRRDLIPARGCQIRAEFFEPLPPGSEAQLDGIVSAPDFATTLFARIPPQDRHIVRFALHVDGFPRAFLFQVPCWLPTSVSESSDFLSVRLLSPTPGASYRAPHAEIPVRLEIDAPIGAFEQARDFLEVGIDKNRDRTLRDDSVVRLTTDRQATIELIRWTPASVLTVATKVSDLHVTLPSAGLRNIRSNILARVSVGDRVEWSQPVEVTFDAAPPMIRSVSVLPDRLVAQGGELQVIVQTPEDDLAGVGKIEAGFDVDGQGKFSPSKPAIPASEVEPGRWIAKLPVDVANVGPVTLLVRPTDKVGNEGEYSKVPLRVVSKEEADEIKKSAGVGVSGQVTYGKQPLPGAKVVVRGAAGAVIAETTADAQGQYAFAKIPAGEYTVNARGLARNRPRKAEPKLTVPAPPAQPVRLDIETR